jgi:hypothetical protein
MRIIEPETATKPYCRESRISHAARHGHAELPRRASLLGSSALAYATMAPKSVVKTVAPKTPKSTLFPVDSQCSPSSILIPANTPILIPILILIG